MHEHCPACGGINHEGHDLIEHCPDCGGVKMNSPHTRASVTYRHCFCGVPKPVSPEITRTVAIEHAGEKISIEVRVVLTKEEIERVICPVVEEWIGKRMLNTVGQQIGHVAGGVW